MNPSDAVKRRDFLAAATGAAAAATVLGGFVESCAAEPGAGRRSRAEMDKLIAGLDARADEFLNVPKANGQFLNLMVKATRARRALEIGTAHGYSTIWIALALEETGGKLTTIEIKPGRAEVARKHVAEAGLADRVTFKVGDAHQIASALDGPFDFVLLDADKGGDLDYLKKLSPKKLAPGGLLLAYGAILLREKMQDYLDAIRSHPNFETVIVSATLEDGFAVSFRARA